MQASYAAFDLTPTGSVLGPFLTAFRLRLRDRRFWLVQAMVVGVTAGHALIELLHLFTGRYLDAVYFVPATLYFFPVVYASLNFGKEGAIPTAIWSAVLAVPNVVLWHTGLERLGEAFQLASIVLFATIVATRVDREIAARREAEQQREALRVSELKYRSLFDSAGQPIIVCDRAGTIREYNAAASALLGPGFPDLRGASVKEVLGEAAAASMPSAAGPEAKSGPDFVLKTAEGEVWLEPVWTGLPGSGGVLLLGLFRDVTSERGFQSYAREIVRAQEEERQRIARELHDVSLQSIVLLCRRLDAAEDSVGDDLPAGLSQALGETRAIAEGIGAELRRFSRDLRPSVLDDLGLVPAIRTLLAEMTVRGNVAGQFVLSGTPVRLAPNAELSLFRIAQEGLRNAERHAQASRVTVRLSFEPSLVVLRVIDNGRGFQVPALPTNLAAIGRLGLMGMQERASLAGGTCQILSRPGQGTRIIVQLPISGLAVSDQQPPASGELTAQR